MCGIHQCFYWSPLVMFHFCDCSEGAVLWLTFLCEEWSSEGKIIYFPIFLYYQFSHTFFVNFTPNTVLFQVWYSWGPGYLKGYGLILLTSVFVFVMLTNVSVGVLMLIWSILMFECIEKFWLTMCSIIEWDDFMSIAAVSRFSNNY